MEVKFLIYFNQPLVVFITSRIKKLAKTDCILYESLGWTQILNSDSILPLFQQEMLVADNNEVEAEQEPTEEDIKELTGPKKSASQKKID